MFKKVCFLNVFLFFAICTQALAQSAEDVQALESFLIEDMHSVRHIVHHLEATHPPDKFIYVTVGSSPAVLQAFMAVQRPHMTVINIPLTGLNTGYQNAVTDVMELKLVQERIQKFVEDTLKNSDKGVVLIDYVYTGRTLRRVREAAELVFQNRDVVTYGLFASELLMIKWATEGASGFLVGQQGFGEHLYRSSYNPWAEHISIDFRQEKIEKNPWNQTLLRKMWALTKPTFPRCSQIF